MGKFKIGDRVVQDFTKDCCNLVDHWNDYWKRTEGTLFDDEFVITRVDRSYVTYSNRVGGSGPSIGESYFKPASLKIEAGKFYKTRDGQKVGPLVRNGHGDTFWKATDLTLDGYGSFWCENGRFYSYREFRHDLIAEWVDEPAVAAGNDNRADAGGGFKVGDRLRLIASPLPNMPLGTEVIAAARTGGVPSSVHFEQDGRTTWRPASYFELVTPTNPAIVALIENGQPRPSVKPYVHVDEASASKEAARLAGEHKGQSFGVYVLTQTVKEDVIYTYKHEWQRLAANGEKISAIKALREITGLGLKATKDAVENWIANDQQYSRIAA